MLRLFLFNGRTLSKSFKFVKTIFFAEFITVLLLRLGFEQVSNEPIVNRRIGLKTFYILEKILKTGHSFS
jgi:hypothetical protein